MRIVEGSPDCHNYDLNRQTRMGKVEPDRIRISLLRGPNDVLEQEQP